MSLYLDQKYLSLISNRLPFFKRKDDHLYNCRCIVCGDSSKNKRKARGYFFHYKNELRYKCHNCDVSMSFGNFLKDLDSTLYSQYSLEKYTDGTPIKLSNTVPELVFTEPQFKTHEEKLLDRLLDRLDTLPDTNEAVVFATKRNIPKEKFKLLYYIDNVKNIIQLNESYKESIRGNEPRLVLPFYDNNGQLSGVTCRALRGETLRYITVKVKEDAPLIFGISDVDTKKTIYVVEGPIDSLFIDNCIAVSGTSFGKINSLGISTDNMVLIFDNQPRNKEVCKIIEKNIDQGYNVVIWPQNIEDKDINDMVTAGRDVKSIIKKNTFKGLTAKAKFIAWKRC
jgi:hypothetical protein